MRGLYRFAAVACVVTAGMAIAASAHAQTGEVPCRKGILWPFSREPGDCLTDVEKKNGQTGVYGNANASAPAPQAAPQAAAAQARAPAQTAAQPESRDGITNLWGLFGSRDGQPTAAAPAPAPVVAAPAPQAAPAPRPVVASATAAPATAENCNKGILWPFSRSPGDCLTDVEKKNGQTGVYGNPYGRGPAPVAAAPQPAPATAAAQPESRDGITNLWGLFGSRDPAPVAQAPLPQYLAPQAAPAAPVAQLPQPAAPQYSAPATAVAVQNCTKGMFWPFSRSPGDCLTDVERQNGQTGVYGNPNAVGAAPAQPQAQPNDSLARLWAGFGTAPAPVPQVAAQAPAPMVSVENCSKGFLWPFSRETGDCLTDVEKANGQTGVYGNPNAIVRAPAPAQAPFAAAPAAPQQAPAYIPAPAQQAPAVVANAAPPANAAACTKGWFWPFSRKPGDCLTDVEKKNGQTGVYGNPNAVVTAEPPAQLQQVPSAVATYAPAGNGTACNKGWFWPFSRSPGDCLTDTEIRNGQTGTYGNRAALPGTQVVNLAPANSGGGMFGIFGSSNANNNRGLLEDAYAPVMTAAPPPANTFQADAQVNSPQQSASPAAPAVVASLPPAANAEAACNKGWLWPFSREPGDCLTDTEKRNGQTGVYRGAEAAASNVAATQASQPVVNAPAPAAPPAAAVPVAPAAPTAAAATEAACTKGFFWPFSRSPGDCLTDTEKKNGQTGVYGR